MTRLDRIRALDESRSHLPRRGWSAKRKLVLERDGGICQACGATILVDMRHPMFLYAKYECGHIIDRTFGGSDDLENLAAMHYACNRLKPDHVTIEEYEAWRNDWPQSLIARALRGDMVPGEIWLANAWSLDVDGPIDLGVAGDEA